MMPGAPNAASPTGLQYDELVRFLPGATPPPPGNFAADVAAVSSPAAVAATPAPRRHGFGNLGAIAGSVLSGDVKGAVGGAASEAVGGALDAQTDRLLAATAGSFAAALRGLTQGRVERHSFYSGWERVDDLAAQTATIQKCDLHQIISLDLAKKTYTLVDTTAKVGSAPAPPPASRRQDRESTPAPEQPGTAVAQLSNVVTELAPKKLDGLDTNGYDDSSTFTVSQATGSCRNGTFGFRSRTYYSKLAAPRLVCPVDAAPAPARQAYPREPANFVASGGCRPTFTAHKSGPLPPVQNLSLYSTMAATGSAGADATPAPGGSPAPGFVFLTERGNVHTLGASDENLFEIPAGFTRVGP